MKTSRRFSRPGTEFRATKRKSVGLERFVLGLALLLGPPAVSAPPPALKEAGWQSVWERAIAAAKREGEVRLWGDMEITHPEIVAAFRREHPFIRVVTVTGKAGELMPRIVAERRAGKYLVDVYSGGLGGAAFFDFYRAGVLDPLSEVLILPEVVDPSRWLNGSHHYADAEKKYVFMYEGTPPTTGLKYNTEQVKPQEFKSYWDLLKPRWKGKILLYERVGVGSPTLVRFYYNPALGREYLARLIGEMEIALSTDRRQATDWLARGRFPLCIDCADVDRAKKQGLPVDDMDRAYLREAGDEISTAGNSGLALVNRAPNPNAAKLFLNWFLSRQGQSVWQRVMNTVVVEPSNSMRIDIPKDDVLPEARRDDSRSYRVTGFLDPKPAVAFIREALSKARAAR